MDYEERLGSCAVQADSICLIAVVQPKCRYCQWTLLDTISKTRFTFLNFSITFSKKEALISLAAFAPHFKRRQTGGSNQSDLLIVFFGPLKI